MLEEEPLNKQGDFEEEPKPPLQPLDKNRKIAAASLAVFAVLIVALWAAQLKNNIYGPFNRPAGKTQVASEALTNDQALKTKDTDGDGLSDYDELNIYKTSPYLEDTDGDELKDGEEVKNGADPNCPKGRTCFSGLLDDSVAGQATSTPKNDTVNSLLNQFGATNPADLPAPPAPSGLTGQPNLQNPAAGLSSEQFNILKNIDAASLRQLLIQKGMPKETLDKISDEELMKSYSEVLQ